LAYKKLPNDFYENWAERYYKAVTQVYPDPSQRAKALEGLYNEVETGMVLLGATAIEDKLQDGVPECITALATAGIKIWVLTGDKIETAINIGFLCGLLKTTDTPEDMTDIANAEMILIQVKNASSEEELRAQLSSSMEQFFGEKMIQSGKEVDNVPVAVTVMSPTPSARSRARRDYALIIDGQSLKFALENDDLKATLLDLGCRCKAVICCRVSPLQKAKVVDMVKRGKNVMTLAIGDGANDVSMIQVGSMLCSD
jgi:phospholipid-translocating ATPase